MIDWDKAKRIEFIEGEPVCRFDGILMDEEGCKKVWGYEETIYFLTDNAILHEGILYTDKTIIQIIKELSTFQGDSGEWDPIINQGYGFAQHAIESQYDNSYIISKWTLDELEEIVEIRPYAQFQTDHPEISLDRSIEFENALEEHFKSIEYE